MAHSELPAAPGERHLEDPLPGAAQLFRPVAVDLADIVDFGRKYDLQPFHTDPQRAARGLVQPCDEASKQRGEPVMTVKTMLPMRCRGTGTTAAAEHAPAA